MRRTVAAILLLGVGSLILLEAPAWALVQDATPASTSVTQPQRPTQPASGPGSTEALFGGVTVIEQIPSGQPQTDYWLFVPTDPLTESVAAAEPYPVVIFVHGSSGGFPGPYLDWIEHLVRRGAVVLFPAYESDATVEPEYRYALQRDVRSGLDALEREGVPVDVTRVAVVGISLGGVLSVDYAASAAAAGLPVPAAVMGIAPGCLTDMECLGADLAAFPGAARLLLVTEADETDPMAPAMIERIWEGVDAVPLENRDIVRLVTDGHGKPSLLAVHTQALAGGVADKPDAYDWYGTWKWLDALMGCA
ncbi:MAG: alpha/beta hydrolase, partial [Gemmatimonadota bacterium]|nr:alpha/beta hydrolase [Gemmatimonadota bacterium]